MMNNTINYRFADEKDIVAIIDLLKECKLPFADVEQSNIAFIVAIDGESIIGCIGLEQKAQQGLLRSFAVKPAYRDKEIGSHLYDRLIALAHQKQIDSLHLLTTTADQYFLKKGFTVLDRNEAPVEIKSTLEFSSLCPSSSVYMILKNITGMAVCFCKDVQVKNLDEETKSVYSAVLGNNLQFTSFDVLPNTVFEKHQHISEQITNVLEGELFFEIENKIFKLKEGDSIIIPGGKEHKVWTEGAGAKAIDAWSPINTRYITS